MIQPSIERDWHVSLKPAWESLAGQALEANAYFGPDFLIPSIKSFCADQDVRVFVLWCGDQMVGLAPLVASAKLPRIRMKTAAIWLHDHLYFGAPLIRPGFAETFWSALLSSVEQQWGGCLFSLPKMMSKSEVTRALETVCRKERRACQPLNSNMRALLNVPADPEAYWEQTVSKKRRKEVARQRRRLDERGRFHACQISDPKEAASWAERFMDIEQAGWKGREGSAMGQKPNEGEFFKSVLTNAARAGQLIALEVKLDDDTLAMLIQLETQDGAFFFKTTYDETFYQYSPGVQLQRALLDLLSARGLRWVDSCAVESHPMISVLWSGRREVSHYAVSLGGPIKALLGKSILMASSLYKRVRRAIKARRGPAKT